jgi:predicted transcriptional regulator
MSLKPALSDLEQQLMDIVWNRGSATAGEIQDALTPERPLKDSTIRTVLTRLEEQGYVRHKVRGRTFVYSGVEPAHKVAVRAVKQILDRFCHGSVESLLVGMVDGEMVDPAELQRIADQLARERRTRDKKGMAK